MPFSFYIGYNFRHFIRTMSFTERSLCFIVYILKNCNKYDTQGALFTPELEKSVLELGPYVHASLFMEEQSSVANLQLVNIEQSNIYIVLHSKGKCNQKQMLP